MLVMRQNPTNRGCRRRKVLPRKPPRFPMTGDIGVDYENTVLSLRQVRYRRDQEIVFAYTYEAYMGVVVAEVATAISPMNQPTGPKNRPMPRVVYAAGPEATEPAYRECLAYYWSQDKVTYHNLIIPIVVLSQCLVPRCGCPLALHDTLLVVRISNFCLVAEMSRVAGVEQQRQTVLNNLQFISGMLVS